MTTDARLRETAGARLRALAMGLPGAEEKETWGAPTWRVRDRIFAMIRRDDGRVSAWMKAPPGAQEMLLDAAPERFFRPPYVGPKGWIGVRLDDAPDWEEVAHHLRRSWRMTAPKRLAAAHPESGA